MTRTQKNRLYLVAFVLCGTAATVALTTAAFQENIMFFYTPTQINAAGVQVSDGQPFRLGGIVGPVTRAEGSLEINFEVTDTVNSILVSYTGVLPDLFREGQGVVVRGKLADGKMIADEVLAKHDENYLPPEVRDGLEEVGVKWQPLN